MVAKNVSLFKYPVIILLMICHCAVLQAQQWLPTEDLLVAVPLNYPPYFFVGETGQLQGFGIEVFDEVAVRAGISFRYKIMDNWRQVCGALKNRTADIVPLLSMSEDVKGFTLFTSPVETFPVSIFVRSSNNFIHSREDLEPFQVAIVKDNCDGMPIIHQNTLNLREHLDFDRAFHALISGQVDAMIYPYTGMMNRVRNY